MLLTISKDEDLEALIAGLKANRNKIMGAGNFEDAERKFFKLSYKKIITDIQTIFVTLKIFMKNWEKIAILGWINLQKLF